MKKKNYFVFIVTIYIVILTIGLYLILADKDWRGYVALLSTPLLHTLIKAISQKSIFNKPKEKG